VILRIPPEELFLPHLEISGDEFEQLVHKRRTGEALDKMRMLTAEERNHVESIERRLDELNNMQLSKKQQHREIAVGTLSFLVLEGLIYESGDFCYQLSSKGLSRVNKKFAGTELVDAGGGPESHQDESTPEGASGCITAARRRLLAASTVLPT
jgi:hypothetical protein